MINKYDPLSIDELGALVGYLSRYRAELIREAKDGRMLDEDPHDTDLREIATEKVEACLKVVSDDLHWQLNNY